jgi:hypothetical protein
MGELNTSKESKRLEQQKENKELRLPGMKAKNA